MTERRALLGNTEYNKKSPIFNCSLGQKGEEVKDFATTLQVSVLESVKMRGDEKKLFKIMWRHLWMTPLPFSHELRNTANIIKNFRSSNTLKEKFQNFSLSVINLVSQCLKFFNYFWNYFWMRQINIKVKKFWKQSTLVLSEHA